jgi:hypothetical protein
MASKDDTHPVNTRIWILPSSLTVERAINGCLNLEPPSGERARARGKRWLMSEYHWPGAAAGHVSTNYAENAAWASPVNRNQKPQLYTGMSMAFCPPLWNFLQRARTSAITELLAVLRKGPMRCYSWKLSPPATGRGCAQHDRSGGSAAAQSDGDARVRWHPLFGSSAALSHNAIQVCFQ